MRPQGNGLVELHDSKHKERGFTCMKLIEFLTEDGVFSEGQAFYEKGPELLMELKKSIDDLIKE